MIMILKLIVKIKIDLVKTYEYVVIDSVPKKRT